MEHHLPGKGQEDQAAQGRQERCRRQLHPLIGLVEIGQEVRGERLVQAGLVVEPAKDRHAVAQGLEGGRQRGAGKQHGQILVLPAADPARIARQQGQPICDGPPVQGRVEDGAQARLRRLVGAGKALDRQDGCRRFGVTRQAPLERQEKRHLRRLRDRRDAVDLRAEFVEGLPGPQGSPQNLLPGLVDLAAEFGGAGLALHRHQPFQVAAGAPQLFLLLFFPFLFRLSHGCPGPLPGYPSAPPTRLRDRPPVPRPRRCARPSRSDAPAG